MIDYGSIGRFKLNSYLISADIAEPEVRIIINSDIYATVTFEKEGWTIEKWSDQNFQELKEKAKKIEEKLLAGESIEATISDMGNYLISFKEDWVCFEKL